MMSDHDIDDIAVTGISCRLPGADTPDELWEMMLGGVDQIRHFTLEELRQAGVEERLLADPDYVPAAAVIDNADCFDAGFFGFSPAEAALLDPQQRVFLECAWAALEDAGHDPGRFGGAIGVYAGTFMNKYLPVNLMTNEAFAASSAAYFARNYNDKDFLTGRAAYLFDLTGPAITVQTACSTSLVATHLACTALQSYDCDMALVGGVSLHVPLYTGYLAVDGGLLTPAAQCRPFDADSNGTVPGYGAAVVTLRRLRDALADGDHVRAVIKGTAVNNEGRKKISFTAPSVAGQMAVISSALAVAGVEPDTIGYVEAHGTGTPLGDPIEVTALTEVFRRRTQRTGFCAIGSIKANIGHLDAAAGVAGLIRATLALEHGRIPPLANFRSANPECKLESSPFYVPAEPAEWPAGPRRATVSSFGVGGTNAHVVLEAAPPQRKTGTAGRRWRLLTLSARTGPALDRAGGKLAEHLERHPELNLADVAHTLHSGRQAFGERRFVVADETGAAVAALRAPDGAGRKAENGNVVFMFPGGGTQYPDMGLELYRSEPVFAAEVDRCAALARDRLGADIRRFLFPSEFPSAVSLDRHHPPHVLTGIFTIEYALARQWLAWGVTPSALIGHSLGEYVAACIAGVLDLEHALHVTIRRGEIFAAMPEGRMLSVGLPEHELAPLLGAGLDLAARNAPGISLVSGPQEAIAELERTLRARDIECSRLHIDVASHSAMVEPYLGELRRAVLAGRLAKPSLPLISGVTGTWMTEQDALDPDYWTRHLRLPVQFADSVRTATAGAGVLLEVGPGQTLTQLASAQGLRPAPIAVASMPHPRDGQPSDAYLAAAVGRLWQAGAEIDWTAYDAAGAGRVSLPTYPFERVRHWISPGSGRVSTAESTLEYAETAEFEGETEMLLATLWRELLGVDRIGRHDDFTNLGGHSLLASQLVKRIRQATGETLSIRDVFASPTIASLAARLAGVKEAEVDWYAEATLAPDIRPVPGHTHKNPAAVLLTGATGFLGAFLCAELLGSTAAEVRCLVRAADAEAAKRRVMAKLEEFELLTPRLRRVAETRLVAFAGDLAQQRFGLPEEGYVALGEGLGAIYHCGAWVNFLQPYKTLKNVNVLGTERVLRLAAELPGVVVHHISTLAVLAGALIGDDLPEILEDGPLPPPVGHDTAYSQSKWVAEQLAWQAIERGIPVAVYRPGVVLGDTSTGVANAEDYYTKLIAGCVALGKAPLRRFAQPVGAVDEVARTIVQLSQVDDVAGRAYHTIGAEPLVWDDLFAHVRAFGYAVESVPFPQWRSAVQDRLAEADDPVLAPLADLLGSAADRDLPPFSRASVLHRLGGDAAEVPLAADYFATMLRFLARSGLLPPAPNFPHDQEM